MRALEQIRLVIRRQLFAVIEPQQKGAFKAHLYEINVTRFMTQCSVLMLMDFCSLLMYLAYYAQQGAYLPVHIAVHIVKIAGMPFLILFLSRESDKGYNPASFLDRNVEILYPAMHFIAELLLFFTGPKDHGALLRLAAVPFIMGGIPVIPQRRAFFLELAAYLLLSATVTHRTVYGQYVVQFAYFANLWVVVFPCAILISFTVYSWFVNTYKAKMNAEAAEQALLDANQRLSDISRHDPLTGLLNRRGFQQYFDGIWYDRAHTEDTATVLMIDIDYFKLLNDKYGHLVGDECLVQVTHALSEALQDKGYTLARYGGEEFIAAVYNQPHEETVAVANRLRMQVLGMQIDNPDSDVAPYATISIGVATRRIRDTLTYDTLVNQADECLYFAKRFGRNQVIHRSYASEGCFDIHGAHIDLASNGSYDDMSIRKAFRELSVDCMYLYDGHRHILINNKAIMDTYHLPEIVHNPTLEKVSELLPIIHADKRIFISGLKRCIDGKRPFFSIDVHVRTVGKELKLVSFRANILYDASGAVELLHGTMLTIEKIIAYSDYANRHALTSTTTLLPNRQKLTLDLKEILGGEDASGYLVMLDIRRFREVNGVFGHIVGDKVLAEVAVGLSALVGVHAPVYHYGVDQFVIVARTLDQAEILRLTKRIEGYFGTQCTAVDGMDRPIAFHMVAVAYAPQTSQETLLVDLDIALQLAKLDEGEGVKFFSAEEREKFLAQFNLNKALVRAVNNGLEGFMVFYQPIISKHDRRFIGAEALLRWRDADGNIVPPMSTVPLLEKSGLMARVEPWIFEQVCKDCSAWIRQGAPDDFFVNINLSPNIITRATLEDELYAAMRAHGLRSCNITLEVPETAAILEMRSTIEMLSALRAKGIRIAIDDFGSGYSSLSYLNTLPVDEVKIDRSFVMDIESDDQADAFLRAVVELAKTMDYVVCVEGVETTGQTDLISRSGADYMQGFYFGRPVQADAFFTQFLKSAMTDEG